MSTLSRLDWDDLRVFLCVVRQGHLSHAAKQLRLDHSTVSRRIGQLEFVVGSRLFERRREGLVLTEHGKVLHQHAMEIEESVGSIRNYLDGQKPSVTGTVRISTYEGISSLLLAEKFGQFKQTHPDVRLEVITSLSLVHATRREADVFISFYEPDVRGLATTHAGELNLHLFAAPAYLERAGTPHTRADLPNHDFITYVEDHLPVDTVRWLDDVLLERREIFNSNSMITQMAAAVGGLGLVLLPVFAARHEARLVPVLADQVKVTRGVWVSAHHDMQYVPRIKAVTRFLVEQLRGSSRELLEL